MCLCFSVHINESVSLSISSQYWDIVIHDNLGFVIALNHEPILVNCIGTWKEIPIIPLVLGDSSLILHFL